MSRPATQLQLIIMAIALVVIVTIGGYAVQRINDQALARVDAYQIAICEAARTRLAYQRFDGLEDRDTPYPITEAIHQMRDCRASILSGRVMLLPDEVQEECVRLIGEGKECVLEGTQLIGSKPLTEG